MRPHRGGFLGRGGSMSAPGSSAKRSSSLVKGRPKSRSSVSRILRSLAVSRWRAASRSAVSGGDGSSGLNMAVQTPTRSPSSPHRRLQERRGRPLAEGSRPHLDALLLGYYTDEGKLIYAGRVGTGMSQKVLKDLRRRLDPLARPNSPLSAPPPRSTRFGSPLVLSPASIGSSPSLSPRSPI
jgi:ATP dependent DNA ligase C terminal region